MAWINDQLVARGIHDTRVLDAMRRVPRHLFVDSLFDQRDGLRRKHFCQRGVGLGQVVNAIVYQDELNTVRAELTALRKTADDKRCAPVISPQVRALEPVH